MLKDPNINMGTRVYVVKSVKCQPGVSKNIV